MIFFIFYFLHYLHFWCWHLIQSLALVKCSTPKLYSQPSSFVLSCRGWQPTVVLLRPLGCPSEIKLAWFLQSCSVFLLLLLLLWPWELNQWLLTQEPSALPTEFISIKNGRICRKQALTRTVGKCFVFMISVLSCPQSKCPQTPLEC